MYCHTQEYIMMRTFDRGSHSPHGSWEVKKRKKKAWSPNIPFKQIPPKTRKTFY
jgi:hypothetical protein